MNVPSTSMNNNNFVIFKRNTIKIGEMYFNEKPFPEILPVDLVRFVGVLHPSNESGWKKSDTLIIDLTKSEEVLLKEMDSGTRYEIRRAIDKDSLIHKIISTSEKTNIDIFCDYYDEFAQSKSLPSIFRHRLYALALNKNLLLSSISNSEGIILVQHAHLLTKERAMLLYSSSKYRDTVDKATRSLVGRANRLLHWKDMLFAKENQIRMYDMCGVDITNKNQETTKIAQFKLGFGGTIISCFSLTKSSSIKGLFVTKILRLTGRSI